MAFPVPGDQYSAVHLIAFSALRPEGFGVIGLEMYGYHYLPESQPGWLNVLADLQQHNERLCQSVRQIAFLLDPAIRRFAC